jgi:hypothetical protein
VADVKPFVAIVAAFLSLAGCSGAPVEEGLFFPTWDPGGEVVAGEVEGTLIEDDRCLYVEANDQRTLVVWEDGMGFEDGRLLDPSGSPIARVGQMIHGGGGYYGRNRSHIEDLSGESVPQRCVPTGRGEWYAIIYEVGEGPFA